MHEKRPTTQEIRRRKTLSNNTRNLRTPYFVDVLTLVFAGVEKPERRKASKRTTHNEAEKKDRIRYS